MSLIRAPRPKRGRYFDKPTVTQAKIEAARRTARPAKPPKATA